MNDFPDQLYVTMRKSQSAYFIGDPDPRDLELPEGEDTPVARYVLAGVGDVVQEEPKYVESKTVQG